MKANVTITLVLVCVCVSVTWSAKVVLISANVCLHRFLKCKEKNKTAIMMRLCVFKFVKCCLPFHLKNEGLTIEHINPKDLIKDGYKEVLENMDFFN
ncbi:hypothetical protein ScPMuIL_009380 [Solemya velum]